MDTSPLARRWFWALLLVAVLAMGGLYAALGARPGPASGLTVAATSVVVVLATLQAVRIWMALERARRRPTRVTGRRSDTPAVRTLRDRLLGAPATGATVNLEDQ